MDSPELEHVKTEPAPSVQEVMALPPAPYTEYWHQFGELGSTRVGVVAERDANKLSGLNDRLRNPGRRSRDTNPDADRVSTNDVAEEWYLSLGTLNSLIDSQGDMRLAAANLWHRTGDHHLTEEAKVERFTRDLNDMKAQRVPEQLRDAIHDGATLQRLRLVGQIMLDSARIPTLAPLERHAAATEAYAVNAALVNVLAGQVELTDPQKKVLSDALKAKYDAWFEGKAVEYQTGKLSPEDYYRHTTYILKQQTLETITLAGAKLANNSRLIDCTNPQEARENGEEITVSKLGNGDLFENYYNALMRYTLNVSPEEQRFLIQTAMRRQDEPHDGFNHSGLPSYAFDAKIVDEAGEFPTQVVQLKTQRKNDMEVYADGMLILDDVLAGNDNSEKRREMLDGLSQIFGLADEIAKNERGYFSQFGDDVMLRHRQNIEAMLQGTTQ